MKTMCSSLLSSTAARDGGGCDGGGCPLRGLFEAFGNGAAMVPVRGMLSCSDAGEKRTRKKCQGEDVDKSGEWERD